MKTWILWGALGLVAACDDGAVEAADGRTCEDACDVEAACTAGDAAYHGWDQCVLSCEEGLAEVSPELEACVTDCFDVALPVSGPVCVEVVRCANDCAAAFGG